MMHPDYAHFTALLKARAGIDLGADKDYLIKMRLQGVAADKGHASVDALLSAIRHTPTPPMVDAALDAMTTNETLFFRDSKPYAQLSKALIARAAERRGGEIRIWSAACSTGQEPYSIAMTVMETAASAPGLNVSIVATDISDRCLGVAREGYYSAFETQRGMSPARLETHFEAAPGGWTVRPGLKKMIRWQKLNLLERFSLMGKFDFVFCRNVLIYFDPATKSAVLEAIAAQMNPGGLLWLGGAESPSGLTTKFRAAPGAQGAYVRSELAQA